jgi:hypothetical protein
MARKKKTCPIALLDSLWRNIKKGKKKRRLVLYLYLS